MMDRESVKAVDPLERSWEGDSAPDAIEGSTGEQDMGGEDQSSSQMQALILACDLGLRGDDVISAYVDGYVRGHRRTIRED